MTPEQEKKVSAAETDAPAKKKTTAKKPAAKKSASTKKTEGTAKKETAKKTASTKKTEGTAKKETAKKTASSKKTETAKKETAKKPASSKKTETAKKETAKKTSSTKKTETAKKETAKKTASAKKTENAKKETAKKTTSSKKTESAKKETTKKPTAKKPAASKPKAEKPKTEKPAKTAVAVAEKPAEKTEVILSAKEKTDAPVLQETKQADKKKKTILIAAAAVAAVVLGVVLWFSYVNSQPPVIGEVTALKQEDGTVAITAEVANAKHAKEEPLWFYVGGSAEETDIADSAWVAVENGVGTATVEADGDYYIYAKDSRGNIATPDPESAGSVLGIWPDKEKIYLAPDGGISYLTAEVATRGGADSTVTWRSDDETVVTVDENGKVVSGAIGTANIIGTTPDGTEIAVPVLVTDLITKPDTYTAGKTLLSADVYTDEEAALLDEILFARVDEGGYGTRAGAIAAARFLALEFEYKVPYFFENGRMSPHPGRPYADGEGRFYHRGLYLSDDKYDILDPEGIKWGPATWGEKLANWEEKYHFVPGQMYPNGLDCSGFVSWALVNGGSDVGDMGAGDEYGNNDLCDLGEKIWLNTEVLQSDCFKVGDLIAEDGHMAIIIGLTDEEIWIAESLFTNVRVTHFRRDYSVVGSGLYTYIIPMDDVYVGEGNYTDMWAEYYETPELYEF